ncbi:hypothetical protein HL666_14485 [Bradyrhizobium sp. 83002]|uniref:protein phosphatase 2C domain-containing protein n=1 Tax=Bradyrhizobium aeschynomenes TaxID=2734909 RepID=UPI00155720E9|nr:protein phosphatase 2C domain-containing protein [Bradyrhizobium aeschynomenes]NPU11977.1 hypothetical protein [Bradyrhizobium aeschynomenes]
MCGESDELLRVLRTYTVSKRDDTPNEDRVRVSDDKRCCAVSDGASVSFDSGQWAEILCERFLQSRDINERWLRLATEQYAALYDRDNMSWSHQAAFDRGSFASLLGVACGEGRTARVFSFGDSLLAFVDNGQVVRTIPYLQADEFDKAPTMLSTCGAENKAIDDDALNEAWHDLFLGSHDKPFLLLMTDAIGRWLLDDPSPDRLSVLLGIESEGAFRKFVARERADGRLKRDDSTLVVIG